jgi:hypothetical protein
MHLLILGTDWGKVGVIVAVIVGAATILVTIVVAIYQAWVTRGKARVEVNAYRDETGHLAVVVSNEKGTNTITITSVSPIVQRRLIDNGPFPATNLGAGETKRWDFDIGRDAPKNVRVRVDSGRKHWVVRPKNKDVILS